MGYRDKIIKKFVDFEGERISRKVILALQKRTDALEVGNYYCFTPRSESGLKNIWDEICVQQIEAEFSDYWSYFVLEVENLIEPEIEKLPEHIQQAIWLQIEENWGYQEGEEMEIATYQLVDYIAEEYVFERARRWSNKQINYFIHGEEGSLFYS